MRASIFHRRIQHQSTSRIFSTYSGQSRDSCVFSEPFFSRLKKKKTIRKEPSDTKDERVFMCHAACLSPWAEEPEALQPTAGSQRVGHDGATEHARTLVGLRSGGADGTRGCCRRGVHAESSGSSRTFTEIAFLAAVLGLCRMSGPTGWAPSRAPCRPLPLGL